MAPLLDARSKGGFASGQERRRWAIALLAIVALWTGCTTISADLSEQPTEVTGPFPDDYVDIVRRWIDSDFYDVSTVWNLQVTTPVAGHSQRWMSRKRLHGWVSKVTFKARDSVGASKGKLAYSVLLREGAVISHRKLLY